MGYVAEGAAYIGGSLLVAAGVYLVIRGSFPGWWRRRFLWPLVHITPTVGRLQGVVALALGASLILFVFTTATQDVLAGILVLVALAAYLLAVLVFLLSTWLSRRPVN